MRRGFKSSVTIFLLLIFFSDSPPDFAAPKSFSASKRVLSKDLSAWPTTFYCSCPIVKVGRRLVPDLESCGVTHRKNKKRAMRIEWEHVVPASRFAGMRSCWKKGGRKGCSKDKAFKAMEADLHNLRPAVGELNGDRSNFNIGLVQGEPRRYGACDFEVDFKKRVVEPSDTVKGDMARVYLYMAYQYGLNFTEEEQNRFDRWSALDPVNIDECRAHRVKAALQGRDNPFVSKPCAQ